MKLELYFSTPLVVAPSVMKVQSVRPILVGKIFISQAIYVTYVAFFALSKKY
jgi:hypothetical protein